MGAPDLQRRIGKFKLGQNPAFEYVDAWFFPNKADFYLIGIKPKYQNKGLAAIIFKEMNETFNRRGITKVETNPELEENKAIQALWKNYEP